MTTWIGVSERGIVPIFRNIAVQALRLAPGAVQDCVELRASPASYLATSGWVRSRRENMPVNSKGEPLPWYTYPFIKFLEGRIPLGLAVFEFGMGNSTRWWGRLARKVTTCEHDQGWFNAIEGSLPTHVKAVLHSADSDSYIRAAAQSGETYDLIVVDGRRRVECLKSSVSALSRSGVLVLDNSERSRYREGHEFLMAQGFKSIEFWGLAPLSVKETCTSLYYRSQNCLEL